MYQPNENPENYFDEIALWRSQRLARLLEPSGWLSLTGFGWLEPGENRVGSSDENDIVIKDGPAHLGVVTLRQNGEMFIRLAEGGDALIDGVNRPEARLHDDARTGDGKKPTVVSFGSASFHVIKRDGRKGLRVKNSEPSVLNRFSGLDYFAIDPAWRVIADWIPCSPPYRLKLERRLGTTSTVDVPGLAAFTVNGQMHALLPYLEKSDGDLFFVFSDQTSGKETNDKARFLYADQPVNGKVIIDFNKAHNPPSAFTPYANCPFAPSDNYLSLRVCVGEKKYRGYGEE